MYGKLPLVAVVQKAVFHAVFGPYRIVEFAPTHLRRGESPFVPGVLICAFSIVVRLEAERTMPALRFT
jgi:hypothetical protein